jgi:AAA family ATP:ADP antiporter
MGDFLRRFVDIRDEEVSPVLVAAFFFFCVLGSTQLLRPVRESLGMRGGMDAIYWLFNLTLLATILVNPLFGLLVSRTRRGIFIAVPYFFFAAALLGFYALLLLAPDSIGVVTGQVYYVWHSVFNLFIIALFWAVMADSFSLEQSKRLFPVVAAGGTIGAIVGPTLTSFLAQPLGTAQMLPIGAAILVMGVFAAWRLIRMDRPDQRVAGYMTEAQSKAARSGADLNRVIIGGGAWQGLVAIFQSRYLLGISGYQIGVALVATFIYFTRLKIVEQVGTDLDDWTRLFANLDLATQWVTLTLQLLLAGRLMRWLGVGRVMMILPVVAALGIVGLALMTSYAMLLIFQSSYSAIQRAIQRPTRETLFTVVTREDKYKAKLATDTFVYRGGDAVGSWTERGLTAIAGLAGLAMVVVPLSIAWAGIGLWLGRFQGWLASTDPVPAAEHSAAAARAQELVPAGRDQ